jgi:aminodeoxychorismate synthase component I
MLNSLPVQYIDLTADELVAALLDLSEAMPVCLLDSSGVSHVGSHLLVAGIDAVKTVELSSPYAHSILDTFDALLSEELAAIFTISYELGRKIQGFEPSAADSEPDVFISLFDVLIIHDYNDGTTRLTGNSGKFQAIKKLLFNKPVTAPNTADLRSLVRADVTKDEYLKSVEVIKERIRQGDTYQTNLTQQLTAEFADGLTAPDIFKRLRSAHPAPFSAFIHRKDSTVISVSPERFFMIDQGTRRISTSPIKGTRTRGKSKAEDDALRRQLLTSTKDRAENTMIVDLLRNDLGRVCEYGSVKVEKICDLEEHPSLFHLVSTVSGDLKADAPPSEVLKALFPCGSITGAPKISTMRIIDEVERSPRGLSMGAIGYYVPPISFGIPARLDTSVAIRTMVVRGRTAVFNVGGGIVIDSDPLGEYEESLTKATALLDAINGRLEN